MHIVLQPLPWYRQGVCGQLDLTRVTVLSDAGREKGSRELRVCTGERSL